MGAWLYAGYIKFGPVCVKEGTQLMQCWIIFVVGCDQASPHMQGHIHQDCATYSRPGTKKPVTANKHQDLGRSAIEARFTAQVAHFGLGIERSFGDRVLATLKLKLSKEHV